MILFSSCIYMFLTTRLHVLFFVLLLLTVCCRKTLNFSINVHLLQMFTIFLIEPVNFIRGRRFSFFFVLDFEPELASLYCLKYSSEGIEKEVIQQKHANWNSKLRKGIGKKCRWLGICLVWILDLILTCPKSSLPLLDFFLFSFKISKMFLSNVKKSDFDCS